jgi:RNA polymerase sigma-70 factor (ECF subfamily)
VHADGRPAKPPEQDQATSAATAEAVSHLFREHNRMLVGYLTARLRSVHEAKEVAQEAYVRLLQLQNPGAPSLLRAYLFKTATHLAIDRLRHRAVQQSAERGELFDGLTAGASDNDDPAEQLEARERTEHLLGFLQELPVKCRGVFELHRLEGLTQHEVGGRLGLSERMVRRYITYAMLYCRLRLEGVPADRARREISI